MRNGATGCEVVVSGKLRAQRAKVMKFRDGYLISTGEPKNHYIQESVRHVMMRQGVLGVKVKIMLGYDPEGERGTSYLMPDKIIVHEPKEDRIPDAIDMMPEEPVEVAAPAEPVAPVEQEQQAYGAGGNATYSADW